MKTIAKILISLVILAVGFTAGRLVYKSLRPPAPIVANYPRAVHDTCTGVWAVQTGTHDQFKQFGGYIRAYGPSKKIPVVPSLWGHPYFWQRAPEAGSADWWADKQAPDTTDVAELGNEFQFPDSLTAMQSYLHWTDSINMAAYAKQVADSLSRVADSIQKRRDDSIFTCQHTYQ